MGTRTNFLKLLSIYLLILPACDKQNDRPTTIVFDKIIYANFTSNKLVMAYQNTLYCAGGYQNLSPHPSSKKYYKNIAIYNEETETWSNDSLTEPSTVISVPIKNKILFAPVSGFNISYYVDIYDTKTKTMTRGFKFENKRGCYAVVKTKTLVFFAGGLPVNYYDPYFMPTYIIDIYNSENGIWTQNSLSEARWNPLGATAGDKVVFAGGLTGTLGNPQVSDKVDIYDLKNGNWEHTKLSEPRTNASIAACNDYILIAGGKSNSDYSNVVDVYDTKNNNWTVTSLSEPRESILAVASNNLILFAAGNSSNGCSNTVDIFNTLTGEWKTEKISNRAYNPTLITTLGNLVIIGGGKPNETILDIYDTNSDTWTTTNLEECRSDMTVTTSNNKIYYSGGYNSSHIYVFKAE